MSLKQWNIIHGLSIMTGLVIFHLTGSWSPVLIISVLSVIILWASQWYTIAHLKPAGGYGNLVTLIRYLLVVFIVQFSGIWSIRITGLLFVIPVLLDGLDGYLARRLNQQSKFGALFDLETDSLFVALAGIMLYNSNLAGWWLLPVVYMRYIYILLLTLLRLNNVPEKRTQFGPSAAVFMFISLIAAFIFPSIFSTILLILAAGLIIISFGYSFMGVISHWHAN